MLRLVNLGTFYYKREVNLVAKKRWLEFIFIFIVCIVLITKIEKIFFLSETHYLQMDNGYYFNVFTDDTKRINDEEGIIKMNSLNDYLYAEVENAGKNREFVLKVYIDYEEVAIKINGHSYNSFYFSLNDKSLEQISFLLPNNIDESKRHKLTVFLISGANINAGNLSENLTNSYSIVLDYLLLFECSDSFIDLDDEYTSIETLNNKSYQGLLFNIDYSKGESNKLPPKEITIESGEKIKLAYRVGGYEDTECYAIILMINWNAVKIDNQFYKLVKTDKGKVGYGEFLLQIPLNEGKYEVTGWVIPNPFNENKLNLFPLDSSYRFTINVVKKGCENEM